ncbi:autotransporter-associated beta strand repeat-containing protein [Achromobacter xylosoxidans]
MILDAPSSYQGPTIVDEGVLRAGANGSFVANGSYLINSAGALDLNGKALTMGQFGGSTGTVLLTGATLTVDQAATTTFNGLLVDSGGLIKRGAGTLTLTGTTSYFGDTEVYGGSLRFGKGGNGGSASLPGSATVHAGELAVDDGTRLKIDGRLTLADGARLSLAAQAQDPALRAGEVKIGNNVALNLSGIASLDGTPRTLIASGDRIDGDFGVISVGGVAGPADYLTVNTSKSPDGKAYRVAYDLSWTAANNLAHGSFTVDGLFTVGVGLTDQSVTAGSAWNGKTLTKAGAGTLVLTGDNRYTGGTRNTYRRLADRRRRPDRFDPGRRGQRRHAGPEPRRRAHARGQYLRRRRLAADRRGRRDAGGRQQLWRRHRAARRRLAGVARCQSGRGIKRIGLHRRLAGDDGGLRHQPVGDAVADRRNRRRARHDAWR